MHEVVELTGRPTLRGPFAWNDFKRRGSWSETDQRVAVWCAPDAGRNSRHTNGDVWLDPNGNVWWGEAPDTLGFGKHEGPKTFHYVVPQGEHLRLKRDHAPYETYHRVPEGVDRTPFVGPPRVRGWWI